MKQELITLTEIRNIIQRDRKIFIYFRGVSDSIDWTELNYNTEEEAQKGYEDFKSSLRQRCTHISIKKVKVSDKKPGNRETCGKLTIVR